MISEVVIFCPSTEVSGGTTFVTNLGRAFSRAGLSVRVLRTRATGTAVSLPTTSVFTSDGLHGSPALRGKHSIRERLRAVPKVVYKRIDRYLSLRRLRTYFSALGPEVAVIFTHVSCKIILDESGWQRGSRGPLLIGQHHSQIESLKDEPWLRSAIAQHFADINGFVALTEEDAAAFGKLISAPCAAIGNPTDGAQPRPTARHAVVACLARLSHEKQIPLLVTMFSTATRAENLRHWRLEIYGDGEERSAVEAAIAASGDGDRITLHGTTTDTASVFERVSLNMSASSLEGFGMTILEAAGSGVPTMAFACSPGVTGLLADGRGILIPPGDSTAYAASITNHLAHPDELREYGYRALALRRRYAPEIIAKQWIDFFVKLENSVVQTPETDKPIELR